jgi:dUTP pyrophosphatase
MKIYIKYHNQNCKLETFGNWIDLKSAENVVLKPFEFKLISLGVSMKLPKYFQVNIVPRSSTFIKKHLIQHNHYVVIDGPDKTNIGYSGNNDIWKFGAIAFKDSTINEGERLCQFEIRPTMKAPWYVKLKWIFDNNYKFIEVDDLGNNNRGGFGTSGL